MKRTFRLGMFSARRSSICQSRRRLPTRLSTFYYSTSSSNSNQEERGGTDQKKQEVHWISKEDQRRLGALCRWGEALDLLDVQGITQTMLSTTKNLECAANAVSWGTDDGTSFIGKKVGTTVGPEGKVATDGNSHSVQPIEPPLRYPVGNHGYLADGILFRPEEMEDKWAVFYHRNQVLFVRSWTRKLSAIAEGRISADGFLELGQLHGNLVSLEGSTDEDDILLGSKFYVASLDFAMRSLALSSISPVPLPPSVGKKAKQVPTAVGMWCFSQFGRAARIASPMTKDTDFLQCLPAPVGKLATTSLLHIAVASGNTSAAVEQLSKGVLVDIREPHGFTPLHWAAVIPTLDKYQEMVELLLTHGCPVDVGGGVDDDTPIGTLPQILAQDDYSVDHIIQKGEYLLSKGADVNARQSKGYTTLHRAAELGSLELVAWLLKAGAQPNVETKGDTPLSLAKNRGHSEIVTLLQKYI